MISAYFFESFGLTLFILFGGILLVSFCYHSGIRPASIRYPSDVSVCFVCDHLVQAACELLAAVSLACVFAVLEMVGRIGKNKIFCYQWDPQGRLYFGRVPPPLPIPPPPLEPPPPNPWFPGDWHLDAEGFPYKTRRRWNRIWPSWEEMRSSGTPDASEWLEGALAVKHQQTKWFGRWKILVVDKYYQKGSSTETFDDNL